GLVTVSTVHPPSRRGIIHSCPGPCPRGMARAGRAGGAPAPGGRRPLGRYTRRRFLGRQPLCGTGVTSWMPRISSPAAASDRMAVSRPEPGPFTNTSTLVRPCSWARLAACSAASCAANGVDFREPLNPTFPALAHESVLPSRSVIVTMVLLKVDLMWAWPCETFFFSRRRGFLVLGFATYFPFFRFTPTVFLGPLRVRALV